MACANSNDVAPTARVFGYPLASLGATFALVNRRAGERGGAPANTPSPRVVRDVDGALASSASSLDARVPNAPTVTRLARANPHAHAHTAHVASARDGDTKNDDVLDARRARGRERGIPSSSGAVSRRRPSRGSNVRGTPIGQKINLFSRTIDSYLDRVYAIMLLGIDGAFGHR
jgi:hypothetical protein